MRVLTVTLVHAWIYWPTTGVSVMLVTREDTVIWNWITVRHSPVLTEERVPITPMVTAVSVLREHMVKTQSSAVCFFFFFTK